MERKKYLTIGILALILTACGGGGGGSSTSVRENIAQNINKISSESKKEENKKEESKEIEKNGNVDTAKENSSPKIELPNDGKKKEAKKINLKSIYDKLEKNDLKEAKKEIEAVTVENVKTKDDVDKLLDSLPKLKKQIIRKGEQKISNEDALEIFDKIYKLMETENSNFSKIQNIDNYYRALTIDIEIENSKATKKLKLSDQLGVIPFLKNRIDNIKEDDIKNSDDVKTLKKVLKEVKEMLENSGIKTILNEIKLIDKVNQLKNKLETLIKAGEEKIAIPRAVHYRSANDFEPIPLDDIEDEEEIEDLVPSYLKETAKVWDKLRENDDNSEEIEKILTTLEEEDFKNIEEKMKDLYPSVYSNLAREISGKNKFFNSKDKEAINTLNGNKYGFILLNEYKDVKNYNHITGYKTRQNGFVGSVDFGNNLYGNIGYAYDDIKYKENGKSTIQTIHLGLNKNKKIDKMNLEFALSGEYNFHKNTREMKNFGKITEAKFNSYSIGTSVKVSQKFGEDLYIKPFSKIELAYMKHKKINEKNAGLINTKIKEQAYTSFLPQVGFELGKSFSNVNLFTDLTYSYELGNLNKAEEFSYEFEKDTSRKLVKDNLEKGRFVAKVGANYQRDNFTLGLNLGQDFDKRGNKFVNFSLGYKF